MIPVSITLLFAVPTELKFSPYGSGGNSIKGSAPRSKSDSDFYNVPPREGLGVYRPMRRWVVVALSRLMVANFRIYRRLLTCGASQANRSELNGAML